MGEATGYLSASFRRGGSTGVWQRHTARYAWPMEEVTELLWDDHNLAHVARHDVRAAEVNEVVFGAGPLVVIESSRHRAGRLELFGRTNAGRHLMVVTEQPTSLGLAYVVTARPMSDAERRAFDRRVADDA